MFLENISLSSVFFVVGCPHVVSGEECQFRKPPSANVHSTPTFPAATTDYRRLQSEPARYTALVSSAAAIQQLLSTLLPKLSVNDRQSRTMSCPAPFLSAADYPYTGGFIDGRVCGNPTPDLQCCLACDKHNWVYTNSKLTIYCPQTNRSKQVNKQTAC